jgi:hypothetical protein
MFAVCAWTQIAVVRVLQINKARFKDAKILGFFNSEREMDHLRT